ncbi:NADH-quinone oxidoreductase subunit M [Aeromicrobium camelliae]|uniref:NADH-quinone oxidoreductase subunit M n=2 Tax=Aeromicrobium TaxID=2040 RepID=A0A3N6YJJ9_9ACTN|nr:NADH-quinone oxidoreductase subunit M [Aeromicrobium camelliae]
MMLTVLALTPLLGALVLAFWPRSADPRLVKTIALAVSLVALVLAVVIAIQYDPGAGYQFVEEREWIAAIGVHYALGLNGIGLTLVLLTTVLTPVVILAAWGDRLPDPSRTNSYLAWMLALEGLAIGVFAATDVFLFYVLFEATLVPLYFLIGAHGGVGRSYAAVKFLIYNLVGGLLMLAAIVGLYALTAEAGEASFLHSDLLGLEMGEGTERLLFLGFFIAFAIKAPLWPLHTWLPDAAASASASTSVLMVSIVDKIGTFAMIRWCLEIFPNASQWASPVVLVLAVVSILYGALLAIGQDDLRRLIAFTSVSHFGFIILGIFAFTTLSTAGATLYMFNHGLSTAVLFLVTGMMIARRGSANISDFGGVQKIAPVLAGVLLIGGLSSLSLPGLAPFVSEFMVLAGTFTVSRPLAVVATLGIILAALYILLMYRRTMTGPLAPGAEGVRELDRREVATLAPAVVLIVALGFVPQPLLSVIEPALEPVLAAVSAGDPVPTQPVEAGASEGAQE